MDNAIILQVGVKVLLQNEKGKYLLLHRSSSKYPDIEGKWDIVGGRIDPGKTLMENLKREMQEETGLELVGEPILIAAQDILRGSGRHVVRLTYTGKSRGEVVLDMEENDEYKWLDWNELMQLEDIDRYFKELLGKASLLGRLRGEPL
ncbi:MAG: NUDIX hydrolase [bacterium]|nr:NUDIX hydrolase [bacterium]